MPQRRKEKKAKDVDEMQTEAGMVINIPTKRKRKIRYPKGYDPEMPGEMPDPERWLPKWQQSKYKKMAKKKGIYLKGAQGDAQFDTDATKFGTQSTAHVKVSESRNKRKRR